MGVFWSKVHISYRVYSIVIYRENKASFTVKAYPLDTIRWFLKGGIGPMPALVEIMRPLGSEIQQQPQYSFRQPAEYLIKILLWEASHHTEKSIWHQNECYLQINSRVFLHSCLRCSQKRIDENVYDKLNLRKLTFSSSPLSTDWMLFSATVKDMSCNTRPNERKNKIWINQYLHQHQLSCISNTNSSCIQIKGFRQQSHQRVTKALLEIISILIEV